MPLQKMIGAAFFAALIGILSQLSLPIGAVPHTLQVFAVVLAGVVMGPRYGALSVVVWILLGFFGIPVFAMAQAGPSIVLGPLGGFMIGFVVQAFVCGFCRLSAGTLFRRVGIALLSLCIVYLIGAVWFTATYTYLLQKPMTLSQALSLIHI